MKIKIGDRVRFLNDIGEGRVVGFQKDNIVEVRTSDGWDIPYPVRELIVMPENNEGAAYRPDPIVDEKETGRKKQEKHVGSGKIGDSDISALFAYQGEGGQFSGLKIYLVNDSDSFFEFAYYSKVAGKVILNLRDTLEPGTKILLDEPGLKDLSELKGWHFQGFFYADESENIPPVIDVFIPFQTKKFSSPGAYSENDYLHENAMLVPLLPDMASLLMESLDSADLNAVIGLKERANIELNKPKLFQSGRIDKTPRKIDLHINQLVDKVVGLSNTEIVNIQMGTFHRELNTAITSNESSIIFIHGIGNGTLKQELRKAVEREYESCDYEDASYKEYGYGATLVRIRQNK